jgi:hypothetical protein
MGEEALFCDRETEMVKTNIKLQIKKGEANDREVIHVRNGLEKEHISAILLHRKYIFTYNAYFSASWSYLASY